MFPSVSSVQPCLTLREALGLLPQADYTTIRKRRPWKFPVSTDPFVQKSGHYEGNTLMRHNRDDYVTDCHLERLEELDNFLYEASDNNGLWTALYMLRIVPLCSLTHSGGERIGPKKHESLLVSG